MKRLLILLICAFSLSSSAHSVYYRTINNLDITVTDEYKVEVNKDSKHIFSYDCRPHLICKIWTTTKDDPDFKMMDGMIYESDDLKPLSIDNIEEFVGYNTNFYDGNIRFFVTISTPTAAYGHSSMYRINTETGGVAVNKEEWDWYRYGMPKPDVDNSCSNIVYC